MAPSSLIAKGTSIEYVRSKGEGREVVGLDHEDGCGRGVRKMREGRVSCVYALKFSKSNIII